MPSMGLRPLDANFKRHNGKVYVALCHPPCNTIVKMGTFPDSCPMRSMTDWVDKQNATLLEWHQCSNELVSPDVGIPAMHGGADLSLFGRATILRYARECVARVALVVYRIAATGQSKGAARKLLTSLRR